MKHVPSWSLSAERSREAEDKVADKCVPETPSQLVNARNKSGEAYMVSYAVLRFSNPSSSMTAECQLPFDTFCIAHL